METNNHKVKILALRKKKVLKSFLISWQVHALKHKTSGVRLIELPASALSRTSKLYIFWRIIGEQK